MPLSEIGQMLEADAPAFAEAVQRIDSHLSEDIGEVAHNDLSFDLLDALAVETEPREERMLDLMRDRGWTGWIRPERLAEPPD